MIILENNSQIQGASEQFQLPEAEKFIQSRYELRYNVVTSRVELRQKDSTESFRPLTDTDLNTMYRNAVSLRVRVSKKEIASVVNSDFAVRYDPIADYINGLEKWEEGGTDWIKSLACTVDVADFDHFEKCLKKWLVAMVASLLNSEIVNQTVLVLQGGQGIGKTTWLERLVPNELADYRFSGIVRPGNKDAVLQLTENILINMDDFEVLCRGNSGALKEFITKSVIRERRPYGYYSENYVRRASLVASTNNSEFLHDLTGNRRFLCFPISGIEYQHRIPIDKVWSQAVYLYYKGFQFWFDEEEIRELNQKNEIFTHRSSEEELVEMFFTPGTGDDHTHIMNSTEIIQFIKSEYGNNWLHYVNTMKLGKALTARGYERVKHKGIYRYFLNLKADIDQHREVNNTRPLNRRKMSIG